MLPLYVTFLQNIRFKSSIFHLIKNDTKRSSDQFDNELKIISLISMRVKYFIENWFKKNEKLVLSFKKSIQFEHFRVVIEIFNIFF